MTDKQTFDLKDGHTWVRSAPRVETIVALKSDEQASLSPGAYEVLTGAVERAGCTRESVDDALLIVESYGPWGADLNDAHRRQIVLGDEVKRLRTALAKIADWDSNWGPFPENNEAWRAMVVVTARQAVPELGPNVRAKPGAVGDSA